MSLKNQRRLAAELLQVGENRVWIDPNRNEDVEVAITREEIRKLIHERAIRPAPKKGVSRSRARLLHERKKKGLRSGPGTREGSSKARITQKQAWMLRIRALRGKLREWKARRLITKDSYRRLYGVAGSGAFNSIDEMKRYAETNGMWRKH